MVKDICLTLAFSVLFSSLGSNAWHQFIKIVYQFQNTCWEDCLNKKDRCLVSVEVPC